MLTCYTQQKYKYSTKIKTKIPTTKKTITWNNPGHFQIIWRKNYIRKSKIQTTLFEKQAPILSPSLFQQTSKMPPLPTYVFTTFASFTDHMCMHLSNDPLAKYSPFGLNATEYTGSLHSKIKKKLALQSLKYIVCYL